MDKTVVKVAFLYPDIFCLNGDRGNISALIGIADKLGVKMEVDRINSPDMPLNFDAYDIFYIPSGELKYVVMTAQALLRQSYTIKKAVESGKIFLITGTSIALFADTIIRADKSEYSGLNIGGFDCVERENVFGDDLVFSANVFGQFLPITGCQISMINTLLKKDTKAFGKIIYGYGNNKGNDEGAIINNCILTNTLGPVLIKNPEMTVAIIKQALNNKNAQIQLNKVDFDIENSSAKKIWEFIEQKISK
jgi:CobQ-like glutamine amidotransferase family enzyme